MTETDEQKADTGAASAIVLPGTDAAGKPALQIPAHLIAEKLAESQGIFKTEEEAKKWIAKRVVRFEYYLGFGKKSEKSEDLVPYCKKANGRMVDTTAEGYEKTGADEPLSGYVKAVKTGKNEWRVVDPRR